MLAKVTISNFKNFMDAVVFDLSKPKSFKFNEECIKNNLVNMALVYGHNGAGKSNLGFAIFDLIAHMTDRYSQSRSYQNYLNADSAALYACFTYEFRFQGVEVVYSYEKSDHETLIKESMFIDGKEYFSIDRNNNTIFSTSAKGAEGLKRDIGDSNISIVNYLSKNALLEDSEDNRIFLCFKKFVEKMLHFKYTDDISYIGLEQGRESIQKDIIQKGNLKDFETFLNDAGVVCKLVSKKNPGGEPAIFFKFKHRELPFHEIASSGTRSLCLFYFWYQRVIFEDSVSFLFIDEFDAFYHHSLSLSIVERLKQLINTQVILTSHNTTIISNQVLRPDCYFMMYPNKIISLAESTDKELREAHNIEKMYRAGYFEE